MPRRSRIDAAGALHHVMVGGIERGTVFRSHTDRDQFLDRLGKILQDTKTISRGTLVQELLYLSSFSSGKPRRRNTFEKLCKFCTSVPQDRLVII